MKRIDDLELRELRSRGRLPEPYIPCRINDLAAVDTHPDQLPNEVRQRVRLIRTDLDAFSDEEIHALIRWGYSVARHAWKTAGRITVAEDIDRLPSRPWYPVGQPVPIAISSGGALKRSQRSRRLFWRWKDKYSYLGLCCTVIYAVLASMALCWVGRALQTLLVSVGPAWTARVLPASVSSGSEQPVVTDLSKLNRILATERDPEGHVKPGRYVVFSGVVGNHPSDDLSANDPLPRIVVYESADQTGDSPRFISKVSVTDMQMIFAAAKLPFWGWLDTFAATQAVGRLARQSFYSRLARRTNKGGRLMQSLLALRAADRSANPSH